MAIPYPLTFPAVKGPRSISIRLSDVVGLQASPISLEQTLFDWGGDMLAADVALPPMRRADAEEYVGFLWALRGMLGTFLMGDGFAPRGSWAGSPLLAGAHAAGVRTLSVDGFSAAATGKRGDWLQFGSGSSTRLHKVLEDFTADGGGLATIEIAPRLRAALADNAPLVSSSCVGHWRLASNVREYTVEIGQMYGLRFSCVEALDA
jgi:hypothetical protein